MLLLAIFGSHLDLPAEASSSGRARMFTRELLSKWGLDTLSDVATLLVSELVTNVVRHTRCGCRLLLEYDGRRLRAAVTDADPSPPALVARERFTANGMGLLLVDALSCEWGWNRERSGGKVVWFELERIR